MGRKGGGGAREAEKEMDRNSSRSTQSGKALSVVAAIAKDPRYVSQSAACCRPSCGPALGQMAIENTVKSSRSVDIAHRV